MAAPAKLRFETVAENPHVQPAWSIRRGQFSDGLSAGVDVVEVRNGDFSFRVLPTRGMGIWDAHLGETRIGWNSPVRQPVHPAFVNLQSRHGLGWLDGFNELLVRCGLAFNGPPGRDQAHPSPIESDVTLHGKIANLPAHSVEFIHEDGQTIGVRGTVDETTLFGPQLRLESTITTRLGETSIQIRDVITNLGSAPTELELLYHTNIGSPVLEEGAKFICPSKKVVPRDLRAAEGISHFAEYLAPTPGYAEQVYFHETLADEQGRSLALLHNRDGSFGVSLRFLRSQLPYFSQWKCTQAEVDGYVTGLEPATNLPNFKSFERRQGRVIQLGAGAEYIVDLTLAVHPCSQDVAAALEDIVKIQRDATVQICEQPIAPYCSIE